MRHSLVALTCFLGAALPARGDGLIRSLPADGRWVEYHAVLKIADVEQSGTARLQSVGADQDAGKPARWIEIELKAGDVDRQLYKLLVREEHLRAGFDPLDHVIRGWQKLGDADVERIDDPQRIDQGFVGALLHAPVKEQPMDAKEREFPWQKGALRATPTRGSRTLDAPGGVQGELTATVWPHPDVPFGVAGLVVEVAPENSNALLRLEAVVSDFGEGATSLLPEAR